MRGLFYFCLFFLIQNVFSSEKISEKKAIFCGVVKNCARFFEDNKMEIERLGSLFSDYAVIIYENNSKDYTKLLYSNWAKQNNRVIFVSEDLSEDYLKSYTPLIGDFRTELIARARNKTLDIASSHVFDDFDYVIMMDLDDYEPLNIEAFISTFENPLYDWDAVFANGSYDLYSLKSNDFACGPELTTWAFLQKELYYIGFKFASLLKRHNWYPVDSFFGGLGIYKREAILETRYTGKFNSLYLNKILAYNNLQNISERPQYKSCLREISDNFQKYYDFVVNNIMPKDGEIYTCEHILFNLALKEKGFDKMYINSELTRRSKTHTNF
jgi:hypothetical protein